MQQVKRVLNPTTLLLCILAAAAAMRFYHLTYQSLWLDELHTMNGSNPNVPWSHLFNYVKTTEYTPILFFALERILFTVFGYTEFVARVLPAITGVLTVAAMYALGKELLNKRLGLIAAALCCVNYFNLFYSQDARAYILLWLFTSISYLYLIRLYKSFNKRDAIWYIVFTTLMLNTSYFSWVVIFTQLVLISIWGLAEPENKFRFFLRFFVLEGITFLLYLPWIIYSKPLAGVSSFWADRPYSNAFSNSFHEYFGFSGFLFPFLYLSLIIYLVRASQVKHPFNRLKAQPLYFSFVFLLPSIALPMVILYLKSILDFPVYVTRYTITAVPAVLLCIAYGMELIRNDFMRYSIVALFVFFSLFDLKYDRKYYDTVGKEQFREMVLFFAQGRPHPVINELTNWHQQFYVDKYNYKGPILRGKKELMVDDILSGQVVTDTFYIVGAHGDAKLDPVKKEHLDTAFVLIKEQELASAWAQQYGRKK